MFVQTILLEVDGNEDVIFLKYINFPCPYSKAKLKNSLCMTLDPSSNMSNYTAKFYSIDIISNKFASRVNPICPDIGIPQV
jgi:hypothetical protein